MVVSCARHEFFGISMVEAVAAGAYPLLPNRLAYPEVFDQAANPDFFYDGGAGLLSHRLSELAAEKAAGKNLWGDDCLRGWKRVSRYFWPERAAVMDAQVMDTVSTTQG